MNGYQNYVATLIFWAQRRKRRDIDVRAYDIVKRADEQWPFLPEHVRRVITSHVIEEVL